MLTAFWLLFSTTIGLSVEAFINHPEPATWIGGAWGFGIGVLIRLLIAAGSGEGFSDILGGISDLGSSDGGSCGGDSGSCGGD
ncbi:MAG: hypothetical protein EO766_11900 [Hydrotalea sp. AMD]|uniref:hypothetical protein n=1 Tax=Hydrotalea sp. AMD TaxID=2501297 RepID=UPI001024C58F|nr:hypothetical protein [Hydrotalea sp. AMD]RWZ87222.1 MAG: hypothetical protein EO766_11900 [Hydrotalea sp. AMD]